MRTDKPRLSRIFTLRCPRCGVTPLQAPGSWFNFRKGCATCDYQFDREPGYFWGAAWIITYTGASVTALALGVLLYMTKPEMDPLLMATIAVSPVLPVAVFLYPYSRAAWMWFDHLLHPLEPHEHLDAARPENGQSRTP